MLGLINRHLGVVLLCQAMKTIQTAKAIPARRALGRWRHVSSNLDEIRENLNKIALEERGGSQLKNVENNDATDGEASGAQDLTQEMKADEGATQEVEEVKKHKHRHKHHRRRKWKGKDKKKKKKAKEEDDAEEKVGKSADSNPEAENDTAEKEEEQSGSLTRERSASIREVADKVRHTSQQAKTSSGGSLVAAFVHMTLSRGMNQLGSGGGSTAASEEGEDDEGKGSGP